RLAALAAEAARRAGEGQPAGQSSPRADALRAAAEASREAARSAAAASREASRATEAAARAANSVSPDAAVVVRKEAMHARDAAERAWEAVDEAKDRPAQISSGPTVVLASSPGMFQSFRRSMHAEAGFAPAGISWRPLRSGPRWTEIPTTSTPRTASERLCSSGATTRRRFRRSRRRSADLGAS